MPYSESLASRVCQIASCNRGIVERKMFGGIGFLLHGNMLVGVWYTSSIARIGPTEAQTVLKEPYVMEFDLTGRPMKGWVLVQADGLETDEQLGQWIQRAVDFVETLPRK